MPEEVSIEFKEGPRTLKVRSAEVVQLFEPLLIRARSVIVEIATDARVNTPFTGADFSRIEELAEDLYGVVIGPLRELASRELAFVEDIINSLDPLADELPESFSTRWDEILQRFADGKGRLAQMLDALLQESSKKADQKALRLLPGRIDLLTTATPATYDDLEGIKDLKITQLEEDLREFLDLEALAGTNYVRKGCLRALLGPEVELTSKFFEARPECKERLESRLALFLDRILGFYGRLQSDFGDINILFFRGEAIKLVEIKPSDGETHKGGNKVQFLKFVTGDDRKLDLVYKPSDIELDRLIVGNSDALKDDYGLSLSEIINLHLPRVDCPCPELASRALDCQRSHENLVDFQHRLTLPTYRILPRFPGSTLERDGEERLPVFKSYGYIEFLEASERSEDFYDQWGALMALATCFSISDLHAENYIFSRGQACLIDLEVSLNGPMDSPAQTGLTQISNEPLPSGEAKKHIIHGFRCALKALRLGRSPVEAWLKRLSKCVARYVPIPTADLLGELSMWTTRPWEEVNAHFKSRSEGLHVDVVGKMSRRGEWQAFPVFALYLEPRHCFPDFQNGDVPAFYHRLDEPDLLNSRGEKVTTLMPGCETFFPESTWMVVARQLDAALSGEDDDLARRYLDKIGWNF